MVTNNRFVQIISNRKQKLHFICGEFAAMAEASGLSKKDCEAALAAFITTTESALKAGNKVQLVGFGSFEVKERAARTGKNPATGEQIDIPASKAPAFKAGKAFKDAIQ